MKSTSIVTPGLAHAPSILEGSRWLILLGLLWTISLVCSCERANTPTVAPPLQVQVDGSPAANARAGADGSVKAAPPLSPHDARVVILGAGTPIPHPDRFGPATAIVTR
ncbi:MAG: hypothetical protein JRG89_09575, partial [Deltaproteobacteria bacterium]|nr:hypothetical protein [Deltaproteobacteria bacterium]